MKYYDICLQTIPGRDAKPARRTGRNLAHLPFYDEIMENVAEYDRLRALGLHVAARSLKEDMLSRIDAWYDAKAERDCLEVEEQELLTAAREHAGFTELQRDAGVPF